MSGPIRTPLPCLAPVACQSNTATCLSRSLVCIAAQVRLVCLDLESDLVAWERAVLEAGKRQKCQCCRGEKQDPVPRPLPFLQFQVQSKAPLDGESKQLAEKIAAVFELAKRIPNLIALFDIQGRYVTRIRGCYIVRARSPGARRARGPGGRGCHPLSSHSE
jgi:hypothetical protein